MNIHLEISEIRGVGPRIREILDEKKIPVRRAAEDLNIDPSYYYKMLKGTRQMTLENVIEHCLYLDVSIGYLLFGRTALAWDSNSNIKESELDILFESVISSLESLPPEQRARHAPRYVHRFAVMIESMY